MFLSLKLNYGHSPCYGVDNGALKLNKITMGENMTIFQIDLSNQYTECCVKLVSTEDCDFSIPTCLFTVTKRSSKISNPWALSTKSEIQWPRKINNP